MIERFQIEDIVVQDSSGVLFRALDTKTDKPVALRRLFPRGPEGGGLNAGEQAAYQAAVEKLAEIAHPALRSVHCGGCDPVDGMPFIVTEWVEGARLQAFLDHAPLKPEEAIDLLSKALEVSELVAQVLGEEGVWIETGPNTIVVGTEESGRGVTFWISPLRWLTRDQQPGLQSIATLTETVMGWSGQGFADSAAHGLGGWLKWLRAHSDTATVREAREKLVASIGLQAPPLAKNPAPNTAPGAVSRAQPTRKAVAATKPGGVKPKKSSNVPAFIGAIIFLGVLAGGGWWLVRWNATKLAEEASTRTGPAPVILEKAPMTTAEAGAVAAVASPAAVAATDRVPEAPVDAPPPTPPAGPSNKMAAEKPARKEEVKAVATRETESEPANTGKVYTPADGKDLMGIVGKTVTLEGTARKIDKSGSGATHYILFSLHPFENEPRGAIVKRTNEWVTDDFLMSLLEKKVRLQGKVSLQDKKRAWIEISKKSDIQVIE